MTYSKIISNELDQAPKKGNYYKKVLSDPKLKKEIISAFEKSKISDYEKHGLFALTTLSSKDIENLDINLLESIISSDIEKFKQEWIEFRERRDANRNNKNYENEVRIRFWRIQNKRLRKKFVNGYLRLTNGIQNRDPSVASNVFDGLKKRVETDYLYMTKRSKIKNNSVNFQIFGLGIVNYMPPTLSDYIKAYSNKLSELERLFYSNNENPNNKKFNIIGLKKFYIEAVLVCKIFIEESKKYEDINNQKLLEDWLKKIINQLEIIDSNNTENLKDALDSYNLN